MTRNVLAVGLLCAACCAAGYVRGFGVAETRGRALLAEQAEASASEREALAVAAANDRAHWLEDTGYDPAER